LHLRQDVTSYESDSERPLLIKKQVLDDTLELGIAAVQYERKICEILRQNHADTNEVKCGDDTASFIKLILSQLRKPAQFPSNRCKPSRFADHCIRSEGGGSGSDHNVDGAELRGVNDCFVGKDEQILTDQRTKLSENE
jgi:hypothetical protein